MSRFFATGSDSEAESSSSEDLNVRQPVPSFTFSDDEDDVKRIVRSTKEKRYEELTTIIKNLRNFKKIKDMSSILGSFEDFIRVYAKSLPVIMKEEGSCPKFVIKALLELEEFINEIWEDKESRKNFSKNNSKSLGTLRQKFRKYIKEFEEEFKKFKANPQFLKEDDEEKGDDIIGDREAEVLEKGSNVKIISQSKIKSEKIATPHDSESDWGSDSDTESSTSDDENNFISLRERFLKKTVGKQDNEHEKKKKEKRFKTQKPKQVEFDEDDGDKGEWKTVTAGTAGIIEKPKMFAKDADIDASAVVSKLNEVMAARGKKRTDRRMQIEFLHELKTVSEEHNLGPAVSIKIHFNIISAIFDYNPKVSEPMKLEFWKKLVVVTQNLLTILLSNDFVKLSESISEENEELEQPPYKVRGCILTVAERLDDEFTKFLKECDPHSNEYVERLKDEVTVTKIIEQVLQYVELQGDETEICRVYLRKIDHLYYKFDPNVLKKKQEKEISDVSTSVEEMDKLCRYIYSKDKTDRIRTRAILSHIFHHALHDNWFQARDLILMSHLQETIHHSDPSTQILYNRMMANLGLCAFRAGNIKDAHQCLVELMMTGKPKELLAQGLIPQRQHERSLEQEKVEKQRQMPFHMHINLELLECVYLVSAMLLEIPYMAAHEFDARRRMISKTFYQQLRSSERQSLVGPPESMREHIVAAAKAMRHGDWESCVNFVINTKMNTKVWDLFYEADRIRSMLTKFVKEETMRTYLFTYSYVYASISVPYLSKMFELSHCNVHSVISKMIINEELMASLDDPSETVVLHRSEPSRLQALATQLTDKVTNLVDANERIFELKQGNFFNRGSNQNYNRDRQNYRQQSNQNQSWNSGRRNEGRTRPRTLKERDTIVEDKND